VLLGINKLRIILRQQKVRDKETEHTWNYRSDLKTYINNYSRSSFCSVQS